MRYRSFLVCLVLISAGSLLLALPEESRELRGRVLSPEGKGGLPLSVVLAPYIKQREEVVVTALRYPEPSFNVPAASAVLSGEALSEGLASNLAMGGDSVPGVSLLGSGGFSLVPSIRGLARNRVL